MLTFLVLGQAEVYVPSGHEDHVISKILALDLELLHDDNVCFENVEHGLDNRVSQLFRQVLTGKAEHTHLETPCLPPWLVPKWIANAVYYGRVLGTEHVSLLEMLHIPFHEVMRMPMSTRLRPIGTAEVYYADIHSHYCQLRNTERIIKTLTH